MSRKLCVNLAGVELKNPVVTASGTFGSGKDHSIFFDLGLIGGVTVKGVSHEPWPGNPPPRIAETYGGMLNAVGLQNNGAKAFIENDLPFLRGFDTKVIVNLCGRTVEDYVKVVRDFENVDIDILELNISCPNIKMGGIAMGTCPKTAEEVTRAAKKYAKVPLFVKLSPNVTDIISIAKAVEAGGADGISLINTLLGMKIDIANRTPLLGNTFGGLSGRAIKPIALRMVYQVAKNVNLPIIGMGGVATGEDAIEFIMAGATAVAVGTANFTNPYAMVEIVKGIESFVEEHNVSDINEIRGVA